MPKIKTATSLFELTGHNSGLISYDGNVFIVNWAFGLPKHLSHLGVDWPAKPFKAIRCKPPQELVEIMKRHEQELGYERLYSVFTAWRLPDHDAVIVVSDDWI